MIPFVTLRFSLGQMTSRNLENTELFQLKTLNCRQKILGPLIHNGRNIIYERFLMTFYNIFFATTFETRSIWNRTIREKKRLHLFRANCWYTFRFRAFPSHFSLAAADHPFSFSDLLWKLFVNGLLYFKKTNWIQPNLLSWKST